MPLITSTDILRLRQPHSIIQKIVAAITRLLLASLRHAAQIRPRIQSPRLTDKCRSMGNRINPLFNSRPIELICERKRGFCRKFIHTILGPQCVVSRKNISKPGGGGGSQISNSIANVELLILKHQPRTVVFYAGDNDIAAGKTAERVASDFAALAKRVHATLTQTKILFIAIKPSIARWNLYSRMTAANELISTACHVDERLPYIDVATPMIGQEGTPTPELFVSDGLHLSASGYGL